MVCERIRTCQNGRTAHVRLRPGLSPHRGCEQPTILRGRLLLRPASEELSGPPDASRLCQLHPDLARIAAEPRGAQMALKAPWVPLMPTPPSPLRLEN